MFSLNSFLRPLVESDTNIRIYDMNNVLIHTFNPFVITRLNVSNNLIKINLKYNKILSIDFSSGYEAQLALAQLQVQVDILREKTPFAIDKQIQNYVESIVATGSSPLAATGSSISKYYGITSSNFLGEPVVWIKINVNGVTYSMPGY
jgi:hypothetical protein